jgi:choline kinase
VGFGAAAVERQVADVNIPGMHVRTLFNPLYDRADNLLSCAMATSEMDEDFLLLNGDTLADPVVITRLLASPETPVAMAVAQKDVYDADDMKVSCHGAKVRRVGKHLGPEETQGEAIGFSLYRGRGPALFAEALAQMLSDPEATRRWYLSVVDILAGRGHVNLVSVGSAQYAEIDYAADLPWAHTVAAGLAQFPASVAPLPWVGTGSDRASQKNRVIRQPVPAGSAL